MTAPPAASSGAAHRLPEAPRAMLVVNPKAGGGRRASALQQAIGILVEAGWQVDWRLTEGPGHAEQLSSEAAAAGLDLVAAAGGDGTVHEVAQGLAGSATALALLPAGTGNVLAGQLGLVRRPTPLNRVDLPAAARALMDGVIRHIDLGFARPRRGPGRYFVLWAGIGLDAEIIQATETSGRTLKRLLGPAAFGIVGAQALLSASSAHSLVRAGDLRVKGDLLMALVSNVPLYGGAFEIARAARLDDGLLDTTAFLSSTPLATLGHLGGVLTGTGEASALRFDRQSDRVRILARRPLPVHLDAEPFGTTPLSIEVRPAAMKLLVPTTAPDGLFGTSPASSG